MVEETSVQMSKLQKKELLGRNLFTFVLLAAVAASVFYGWALIVPFVLAAVQDTFQLAVLCAITAAVVYVCADKQMRMLAYYGYKSITRGITARFVELDPIGILNTYVSELQSRLAEMDKSIGNLKGQKDKLKARIDQNEEQRVHELKLAQQAQKRAGSDASDIAAMRGQIALRGRQAGRLQKSNMSLQTLYDRMDTLYRTMRKMRDASALLAEDIKNEVDVKTQERTMLLAGYNAFSKARKIMAGGGAERELYDMTTEALANDYALKMGEIEEFMDVSKGVIDGMDLDNGIYEEDALAQLQQWQEKGSTLLSMPPPSATSRVRVAGAPEEVPAGSDGFSDLFDKQRQESPKDH